MDERIKLENYKLKEDGEGNDDIYIEEGDNGYITLTDYKEENTLELRPSEAKKLKQWLEDNDY